MNNAHGNTPYGNNGYGNTYGNSNYGTGYGGLGGYNSMGSSMYGGYGTGYGGGFGSYGGMGSYGGLGGMGYGGMGYGGMGYGGMGYGGMGMGPNGQLTWLETLTRNIGNIVQITQMMGGCFGALNHSFGALMQLSTNVGVMFGICKPPQRIGPNGGYVMQYFNVCSHRRHSLVLP